MLSAIEFIGKHISISDEEMNDMLRIIQTATYAKNDFILKQGSVPREIGFVVRGCVRMFYTDENGEEHTTGIIPENHPITASGFLSNPVPSPQNVVALEPVELITTSRNDFFDFLEKYPRYESALRKIISEYMVLQGEQSRLLRIPSARERYEALLKFHPDIIQRVPLKYIASYLGITHETLSRIRGNK